MKPFGNTWNVRAWADLSLHKVVPELKTVEYCTDDGRTCQEWW